MGAGSGVDKAPCLAAAGRFHHERQFYMSLLIQIYLRRTNRLHNQLARLHTLLAIVWYMPALAKPILNRIYKLRSEREELYAKMKEA